MSLGSAPLWIPDVSLFYTVVKVMFALFAVAVILDLMFDSTLHKRLSWHRKCKIDYPCVQCRNVN